MQSTLSGITDWMTYQRWYTGKGHRPRLVTISEVMLPSLDPSARVRILLLRDEASDTATVYQVPIVERDTIPRGAGPHFIGRGYGGAYLFDGPHDPAFTPALLATMRDSGRMTSPVGPEHVTSSRVLSAEQSNTSIIIELDDRAPLIAKVFRVVQSGDNPEVTVQAALTEAGMPFIPAFVGGLVGEWSGEDGLREHGHLAAVQDFVVGASDGWRVALDAASAGQDFSASARALGVATATMHAALAERLPTREPSTGDVVAMVASWHSRLASAIHAAPALAPFREAIEAVYDAAQEAAWPRLQRIHGDLHLGQVLRAPASADGVEHPGGDWRFVDFEGEPMRPLDERTRPDAALRDVAGMLRSFDYAAGFAGVSDDTWTADCRSAYLEGYTASLAEASPEQRAAMSGFGALLAALELDKAVYEVTYEARNRPDWIRIPLRAVERLVSNPARSVATA